jgi:hypothetical protein
MKLIAIFNYHDYTDHYDPYHDYQVIPFEADSLEAGRELVAQRVKDNTEPYEQLGPTYIQAPFIFGHNYGELMEDQTLAVETFTLEEWFEKNQKDINFNPYPED